MAENSKENKLMSTSSGVYLTKQFQIDFIFILAITSVFLIFATILQFYWTHKQNALFRMLVRKIVSENTNRLSKRIINSKNGKKSKQYETQKIQNHLQSQRNSDMSIQHLDPLLGEILKESALNGFIGQNLSNYLTGKVLEVRHSLKTYKSVQSLLMYQPFLILCILGFNFNQFLLMNLPNSHDRNQTPDQFQNINEGTGGKVFVAISMVALSFLLYLLLNSSNFFSRFLHYCQSKESQKRTQNISTVQNHTQTTKVLSDKKMSKSERNENKINQKQVVYGKDTKKLRNGMSFKLRNSLNLLHLVYLTPLLVSVGILIAVKC